MKTVEIDVLDARDEKVVRLLEGMGLNHSTACIIRFLMVRQPCTMKEISIAANITTSAVSIALKKLKAQGIVRSMKMSGKPVGRRTDLYSLNGAIDEVLAIFERHERQEVARYLEKTARAKEDIPNGAGHNLE